MNRLNEDSLLLQPKPKNVKCFIDEDSPFFQSCSSMVVFVSLLGLNSLLIVATYINITSQKATLQELFHLNNSQLSILFIADQVGSIVSLLALICTATHLHTLRTLGVCCVLGGTGVLMYSLPYYDHQVKKTNSSQNAGVFLNVSDETFSNLSASCHREFDKPSNKFRFYTLLCALWLIGVSRGPITPLSLVHIDNNVNPNYISCYASLASPLSVLGPSIVSILANSVSKIYVKFPILPAEVSVIDSPEAWWISFFILGALIIFFSFPFFLFPRQDSYHNTDTPPPPPPPPLKEKLHVVITLFRNPVLVCLTLYASLLTLNVNGATSFVPKYIATQYKWSSNQIHLWLGLIVLVMSILGSGLCSALTGVCGMDPLKCLKISVALQFLELVSICMCVFRHCNEEKLMPSTHNNTFHFEVIPEVNVTESFYKNCLEEKCPEEENLPVCTENGLSFTSPCSAGCHYQNLKQKLFTNCTCAGGDQYLREGLCQNHCDDSIYFMVLLGLRCFIIGAVLSALVTVTLSCVSKADRTMALAINTLSTILCGSLPSPFMFKYLVDSSCDLWQRHTCETTLSCNSYNSRDFREGFFAVQSILSFMSLFYLLLALILNQETRNSKPLLGKLQSS